jgi:polyisoprenoid-binding protein YceI
MALVTVVVLGVGGPYVYIHFIQGKAPAKLKLTAPAAASSAPNSGGTVALDGTWNVSGGSQLGYRVQEVLLGQNSTAVGRTSSVTGQLSLAGQKVTAASFTVDMTTVKSDQSRRDAQFNGRVMDTAGHPTATFKLTQPIALSAVPAQGTTVTAQATGDLTLRSTTRSVTFTVTAQRNGSAFQVDGTIPVKFADWNIPNPSFGPVTTEDHGVLEFLLNFTHG